MTTRSAQEGAPGQAQAAGAPSSSVRPATPADVPEILALVRELAEFERSLEQVGATEADLRSMLFGSNTPSGSPAAYCHVVDGEPGRLAGFALWFLNASTWTGRHGIYLEDLYVRPEYRGQGLGRTLMSRLAAICVEHDYARLEWWVLDWNERAIRFYESLGARPMDEWTVHRITGPDLRELADRAHPPATA